MRREVVRLLRQDGVVVLLFAGVATACGYGVTQLIWLGIGLLVIAAIIDMMANAHDGDSDQN